MTDRISCRCAVPSLLVLAFAGQVGAADTEVKVGGQRGQTTYEVALDELHAVCVAPAALPEQVRSMTPDGKTRLSGVSSLPQLESVASTLARGTAGRTTVAAVLYPAGSGRDPASRSILSRQLALQVKAGTDLAALAGRHRCRVIEKLSANLAVVEPQDPGLLAGSRAAADLATDPAVTSAEVQVHRLVATRFTPIDPETHPLTGGDPWTMSAETPYPSRERRQWHLFKAPRGMHLEPVWGSARDVKDGYTGTGIRIATVDTGVDTSHPDLGIYPDGNLRTDLAYNFAGGAYDDVRPQTILENHGTAIAGLIAEREGRTGLDSHGDPIAVGGVGVAFNANVVPLRFITSRDMGSGTDPIGPIGDLSAGGPADPNYIDIWPGKTEVDFHRAVNFQLNPFSSGKQVHVSCNSWGNTGVYSFMALGNTANEAFLNGVSTGRFNRGLVFVWAAGNDHGLTIPYRGDCLPEDNACYDAWLTRYTIPVGALNRGGRRASYSEMGPTLLVCAPGGEYNFSPYEPMVPIDTTVAPGPNTPAGFFMSGLITTDRSRQWWFNGLFKEDEGYNNGEMRADGDSAMMNSVPPTPSEDLSQWVSGVWRRFGDGSADLVQEASGGPDLDGDGYWDTGEDLDHDLHLDAYFWFDADGDGHKDFGEDVNNNGLLDDGEDINGDGILQFNEDLNGDGIFWASEDLNGDGILQAPEDVNGNGLLDFNEDIDNDGNFDGGGSVSGAIPPTRYISEGQWVHPMFGYQVAGEPDFNRNGIQESNLVLDITLTDGTVRVGVIVDEDLNNDNYPSLDPTPTGAVYDLEGVDWMFDLFEDFNHDTALTRNSDLNSDGLWSPGGEDTNNDHKWTSGDYTRWMPTGYTHPGGRGFDVAGTSFAAANASGAIALMLQARPELTWRDVQHILAHRSRLPGHCADEGRPYVAGSAAYPVVPAFFTRGGYNVIRGLHYDLWTPSAIPSGGGFWYNHWYGFGAINALKAVYGCDSSRATIGVVPATAAHAAMAYPGWPVPLADQVANPGALHWPLLPAEELPITSSINSRSVPNTLPVIIPNGGIAGDPRINLDLDMVVPGGFTDFTIETVELHLRLDIDNRSCLTIGLVSPAGTIAMIPQRINKGGGAVDYFGPTGTRNLDYTFTLRNFLGEHPQTDPLLTPGLDPKWRVIIVDTMGGNGILRAASITVHGYRPYPVPTASSTTPGGIAATVNSTFQVNGANFRQNASREVTMTKALWFDHYLDTSAESSNRTDDDAAAVGGAGDVVADLQARYRDNGTLTVTVPASLTAISPGDATILIANPALPVAQNTASVNPQPYIPRIGYQIHPGPGPNPDIREDEDYYVLDQWESTMTSILVSERWVNGVQTTYPAGVDPITGVPFAAGYDCRVKTNGMATALHLRYSRPPVITAIPDQLFSAATAPGTISFSFTVNDPDINPATVMFANGRTGFEETLSVSFQVFNQSNIHLPDLVAAAPVITNNVPVFVTVPRYGDQGLSIVSVIASDGVTTSRQSFRVGVLTDEEANGCAGGMGLALLGGPLAIWLLRRRRRA